MLFDTHAHLNFNTFKDDADEVIRRTLAEDTWMVLVGSEYRTSKRALEYANKYEKGVYAAVGLHPNHLFDSEEEADGIKYKTRAEEFNYDAYEQLANFEKAVAIGETGLDYYRLDPEKNVDEIKAKQKDVFWQQMLLARNLDLPLIIHCRQAHDDMLEIIQKFKKEYKELFTDQNKPWAVMHCFSGDEDLAWRYFSLGIIISFTGIITFSKQWDDLIRKMPLDKFMIETDCPFLTPEPYRGSRNEPILVKYVASRIAEIKNLDFIKIAERSTINARNFFKV